MNGLDDPRPRHQVTIEAGYDAAAIDRRARWLVRVLTSLLLFPGRDADDERAMIEEFLLPTVVPI